MTVVKPASDATYKMKVILVGMINGLHDHGVCSKTELFYVSEKIINLVLSKSVYICRLWSKT